MCAHFFLYLVFSVFLVNDRSLQFANEHMSTDVTTTDISSDDYPSTEIHTNLSLTSEPTEDSDTIDSLQIGEFEDCFYQL